MFWLAKIPSILPAKAVVFLKGDHTGIFWFVYYITLIARLKYLGRQSIFETKRSQPFTLFKFLFLSQGLILHGS